MKRDPLAAIWASVHVRLHHDSIGVGEDGPTHQPIEQLVTLRATPNLDVVRPAGFNETALAWRHALRQTDRPTALALSRQGLPCGTPPACPTTRSSAAPTCCARATAAIPRWS
jgi:transketolase